jgi:hypothetical protein
MKAIFLPGVFMGERPGRTQAVENSVLKCMFGPKRDDVRGRVELYDLNLHKA